MNIKTDNKILFSLTLIQSYSLHKTLTWMRLLVYLTHLNTDLNN